MRERWFLGKQGRAVEGPERSRKDPADTPAKEPAQNRPPRRAFLGADSWALAELLKPSTWMSVRENYVKRRNKEKQDLDVYQVLSEGARPTAEYYVLIVLSCLIATMGLIQGSAAVIIGAMIIAPLMTPILAFSLGVIWGDLRLLRVALFSVLKGAVLAVLISGALAFLVPISHFSAEVSSRASPSLFDIIVALGSGALAAFGYANKKVSSALTGIAIAVALMPPLCTIGIGLGKLDLRIASGAAILFAINLVSISLAGAVVFWLMKIHPLSEDKAEVKRRALWQIVLSIIVLCAIAVPVALYMRTGYEREHAQRDARRLVEEAIPGSSVLSLEETNLAGLTTLRLTVATDRDVPEAQMRLLASDITRRDPVVARAVITTIRSHDYTP